MNSGRVGATIGLTGWPAGCLGRADAGVCVSGGTSKADCVSRSTGGRLVERNQDGCRARHRKLQSGRRLNSGALTESGEPNAVADAADAAVEATKKHLNLLT